MGGPVSEVACYYCGNALNSAPPGRLDECPQCGKYVHVCRMCVHYDPAETSKQCREDDAEKVHDKQAANFCDYFVLSESAFDSGEINAAETAQAQLSALFGDADRNASNEQSGSADGLLKDAEALFEK